MEIKSDKKFCVYLVSHKERETKELLMELIKLNLML